MIKQPLSQKRLTNVATVTLKSHGKRFQVACYKNKVLNWREGIEKDLNEVIQVETVFTNVSKGEVAKEKDLMKAFGTADAEDIIRRILKNGDLQVSDREREVHLDGLFRDIVQIVVERCVHPQTGRQLTALTVENALRKVGFSVQPDHAAKRQALKAIETLCAEIPESFARAKMRLRLTCPESLCEEIRRHLTEEVHAQIEEDTSSSDSGHHSFTFVCDPKNYRELDRLATITYKGEGVSIQVVTNAVLCGSVDSLVGTSAPLAPSREPAADETFQATSNLSSDSAPQLVEQQRPRQEAQQQPKRNSMKCSTCCTEFDEVSDYRLHCRSEWHNFNLKRKVKSLAPVSEEEFAEISLDVREGLRAAD